MGKKKFNLVLDEDVQRESARLAASFGFDWSGFVNLMLKTVLMPENVEGQESLLTEMFVKELRQRGFVVAKDALQLKGEQWHRKQAKKKAS